MLASVLAPAHAYDGAQLNVSLLTFSPGDVYWQRFGHNALLVRNAYDGTATVYNYGMFDFNQENFFLNFARGRMQYHLSALSLDETLWIYDQEGRGIIEQALALTPDQRWEIDEFLRWNALPENAPYRYDYFLANCSTKLRDAIDDVLDGALRRQLEAMPTPATFRSEAVRLVSPDLSWMLGMDFGLGPAADVPISAWQRSYVPAALMEGVRATRVIGADGADMPLVFREQELLPRKLPDAPAKLPQMGGWFLLIGGALGAAIALLCFVRASGAGRAAFAALTSLTVFLFGFAGLVSLAIWALTDHWSGARCFNLLHYSPLLVLLVPGFISSYRAGWRPSLFHWLLISTLAAVSVAGMALSFAGPGAAARHWIGLSLPVLLALAFATYRLRRAT